MTLLQIRRAPAKEVGLKTVYDAVVVGSGAAGGTASHVLTSRGLNVLLLEAGRKLDHDKVDLYLTGGHRAKWARSHESFPTRQTDLCQRGVV